MTKTSGEKNQISARDQIIEIIERMPEDMCRKLLEFLEAKLPDHIKSDLVVEKRGDSRKQCLINVDYSVDGDRHSGFILDISALGVFIESDTHLPVGDTIEMAFSLPRHYGPFRLSGEIIWSGPQGFGVRFPTLNKHQRKFIKSFSEEESVVYNIMS
jgi:hypothetical protein